jgi:hypothetical protein
VEICENHKLLSKDLSSKIYNDLYNFIKMRNRIHIQNQKNESPEKETEIWNTENVNKCGQVLKEAILYICEHYPRLERFGKVPSRDIFPTPWDEL